MRVRNLVALATASIIGLVGLTCGEEKRTQTRCLVKVKVKLKECLILV